MRVFVTGEKGFIGSNLPRAIEKQRMIWVSGDSSGNPIADETIDKFGCAAYTKKEGELCVHRNTESFWLHFFDNNNIDVIIHNAAVVGTDVVALDSKESTLTNIQGTYQICRAAQKLNIPVCFIGTTVIYDTPKYQETAITETSDLTFTPTLYGALKRTGEDIVRSVCDNWLIMRPLFAYGGEGDMNSLIAKSIYASLNNSTVDMFLNPDKIKDYMHVDDFCDAIAIAIKKRLWNNDFNVSAQVPLVTGDIVKMICEKVGRDVSDVIRWHPQTDYLGNHILSSKKFREASGWLPSVSLEEGIDRSYESILKAEGYNPLEYLDTAAERNLDLTQFYPK